MAENGRPSLQEEIQHLRGELEPIRLSRRASKPRHCEISEKSAGSTIIYRPTYRAVLAKRDYLVRRTLGNGSYSKVKLAIAMNRNEENVAVKIVDRHRAPSDFQAKFLPRELEVWPRLNHHNIVNVLETFDDGRRVYIVLEYQGNGDVLRFIQAVGALDEPLAQCWIWQVCEAARYLHDQDITHRDLKLENLLLDQSYHVKLCDFGFTKSDCVKDLSRTYCGSKSYAAPEILLGHPYNPKKADTWAIGVILYIFITGKMPFDESRGNTGVLHEQRHLEFEWKKFKKATVQEKDLVLRLFTYDFRSRPNIQEVLHDSWLTTVDKLDDVELRDLAESCYQCRKQRLSERAYERGEEDFERNKQSNARITRISTRSI